LEVYRKAMDLVIECYQLAAMFPKMETYGLTGQLQRASVSIPANIAEGHQRQHSREFFQHLWIASGSLAELEIHLQIAARLDYIGEKQLEDILDKTAEVGRMLKGLRKSMGRRSEQ